MPEHSQNQRLIIVDQFRGLAICMMAIFHFCYNLSVFGFIPFAMDGGFYTWFRFVIVTLFFTSVGAGLYLAHNRHIRWKAFWIRQLKISLGAAAITISTFILYPHAWVYFGVLHFIAVASIIALPFIFVPKLAAMVGVAVFLLYNITDWFNLHFLYSALKEILHLPNGTQDLTRLVPWVGMVLIGIYLGKVKFWGLLKLPLGWFERPIQFLSRHSLIFYLVHQAPLFGLAYLLHLLLN